MTAQSEARGDSSRSCGGCVRACHTKGGAAKVEAAAATAAAAGELKFQGFEGERNMRKAMIGAVLMGFGAMLAGGCAIGAGVTGGSIFAATAWLALFCMWVGAVITDYVIDQPGLRAAA